MGYYENKRNELASLLKSIHDEKAIFENYVKLKNNEIDRRIENIKTKEEGINQLAKERQIGFPWLAQAYEELYTLIDKDIIDYLHNKKNPAPKASEAVKEQTKLRRVAEKRAKIAEYLVKFYENMVPSLIDLKEEVNIDIEDEDRERIKDYSEEELEDETINYLSKEEFRNLPSIEKNQIALDNFRNRPRSKSLIGKMYERYIGYLFEEKGYEVEYQGIEKGLEDLGRDLICSKESNIIIVQCKNRSKFKTIYEKHIFQFFGTVFQYKYKHPNSIVRGVFYTTTKVSDFAKEMAKELNIELRENCKYDQNYPCIKCNISNTGEKIYHLPFDQQYDRLEIGQKKGRFYCSTVREAEEKGFRRAYRHNF